LQIVVIDFYLDVLEFIGFIVAGFNWCQ